MSIENRERQGLERSPQTSSKKSALSPWARYWARQHRVPQDSHLVSFGDKLTYTFAMGNDVASIHYDQARGELFYKGHKISSTNVESWLVDLLRHFKTVLAKSEYADKFLHSYSELLNKKLQLPTE